MNPSNGWIDTDPMETRGGPPTAASDVTDASRLAAAKEAAKKKLLRMVVHQAAEELGDADAIVDQAFEEGLVSESLIEGLRQRVRERMTARLVKHVAESDAPELADQAAAAIAEAPEIRAVVDSVERRLAGAIASRALEGMEDEGVVAERIAEEIARANEAAVTALADEVRGMVVQTISDRAWESAVDPDELVRQAESRITADDPAIAEAAGRIAEQAAAAATDKAMESARQRIAESIAAEVESADFIRTAASQVEVDSRAVDQAVERLREKVIDEIRDRVETAIPVDSLATGLSAEAMSQVESEVARRVQEDLQNGDIVQRVAEDATRSVCTRITDAVFETDALMKRVETSLANDTVRLQEAAERARAGFAVQLSEDLIAAVTADSAIASLTDQAVAEVRVQVAQDVSRRVMEAPADDLARNAIQHIDADSAQVLAAIGMTRVELLRRIAANAEQSLSDSDDAARQALARFDFEGTVITSATAATRDRLTAEVAERVLADVDENGIPTDDPRMQAAMQSMRTLVSRFLYAQAMKVASTARERDLVAREVATELHDLMLKDTLEAFAARSPRELADEAHGRVDSLGDLVSDARSILVDRMVGEIAAAARNTVSAEGIDLDHPAVAEALRSIELSVRTAVRDQAFTNVGASAVRDQIAADVASELHDHVTSDALKAILSRNPIELAQAVAAQLTGEEPVILQAIESVLGSVRADVAQVATERLLSSADSGQIARDIVLEGSEGIRKLTQSISEALQQLAREQAVEDVGSQEVIDELARMGSDELRERIVVRIAQEIASTDAGSLAAEAGGLVQKAATTMEAAELLHARIVERIAADALDRLGSVAAASEKARAVAESENVVIEDAVRTLYDMLAAQVGEEVGRRIQATDRLAEAAAGFMDPDDPAVEKASEQVAKDLGALVALRAVQRVTAASYRDQLAEAAQSACADDMAVSVDATEKQLLDRLVERVAQRFSDAGETARRAQERLGSDHAPLIAAGEVLKELVLEDLTRKATLVLLDAAQAADRAFSRIDLEDPRFSRAQDALRQRIVEAMAERSLRALEDRESAAAMARARIADDHEHVVGTAALVREMLLDDIARRSEASLSDARSVALMSRSRVAEDSANLVNAGAVLRDLLLDDLARMATQAFEDARAVAEQAAGRVDSNNDVLVRARAAFKERILLNVLGEAIREISGSVGNGHDDAQQAVFQQAMRSMARESSPTGQAAPPRQPAAPRAATPPDTTVPFVTASEVDGTPSGAENAAASRGRDAAPGTAAPEEAWIRLSEINSDVEEPSAPETVRTSGANAEAGDPSPLIVTEFIVHDDEMAGDANTFDFAWADGNESGGDSYGSADAPVPTIDLLQDEFSGDGFADDDAGEPVPDTLPMYVYGFMAPGNDALPPALGDLAMVPGHGIRFVNVRGVRAIVSAVPSEDFQPDALRARSQDTNWLRDRIRTHARVLDAFKSIGTVVPLRFGMVFENEGGVVTMIEERHTRLADAIERLRGKMEWGVRAVRDSRRMRTRVLESARTVNDSVGSLSTGVAQFVRDELSRAADLEPDAVVETITRHCLARAEETLGNWTADAMEKPLPAGNADIVMNRAYLVEQSAIHGFRQEIARLSAELEPLGIAFELTGPWPAFHFSGIDDTDMAGVVPAQQ